MLSSKNPAGKFTAVKVVFQLLFFKVPEALCLIGKFLSENIQGDYFKVSGKSICESGKFATSETIF